MRVDCLIEVARFVFPARRPNGAQVDVERHALDHDTSEPPFADEPIQADIHGERLVIVAELLAIAAVWCGSHAEHLCIVPEMVEHCLAHFAE